MSRVSSHPGEPVRYLLGESVHAIAASGGGGMTASGGADVPLVDADRLARAREIAHAILTAFNRHFRIFRETTQGARRHFVEGNWAAGRAASSERISLYDTRIREAIADLRQRFGLEKAEPQLWQEVKFQYLGLLYRHRQPELAETFYNSVFVGLFERHYYNNDNIFVRPAVSTERIEGEVPPFRSYYPTQDGWRVTLSRMLDSIDLGLPLENKRRDMINIIRAVRGLRGKSSYLARHFQLQILNTVFYRNKAAYIVGRALNGADIHPFILPVLRNERGEIYVDALVSDDDDVANLFSFARTYFLADTEVPSAVVRFLLSFLPSKSAADMYTAIGFHKQGKAEFYRDFLDHLRNSSDRLVAAPGIKGMVMLVFTLPSYPYVFKVIRDRFGSAKKVTEREVIEKNRFIKRRDRVGRMADTWEFSYAAFPIERFDPELLQELQQEAANKVSIEDGKVVIKHLYIERRLNPLNLFLEGVDEEVQRLAIRDYGNALREISAAGIFPGDLLLKNFGVTRHCRVIFYDYDEIVPINQCNFRRVPEARTYEQEMASEPWYSVGEHDIFPEEFATFLMSDPGWRKLLRQEHGDLLQADTWQRLQRDAACGRAPDVYPYRRECRFPR
jgi:isocitrate dehydrogenase kinase/phosphatase